MNPLQKIGTFQQSVWLDFISRKAIQDGTLAKYIEDGLSLIHISEPTRPY